MLLNVLQKNRHPADDIFTRLFSEDPASLIFKFIDEDTIIWEDLGVVNTMPKVPFALTVFDLLRRAAFSASTPGPSVQEPIPSAPHPYHTH